MNRPPRPAQESIFDRKTFGRSLLQGISVLVVSFLVFFWSIYAGKGETEARTISFVALMISNLMLILFNLSQSKSFLAKFLSKNKAMWAVVSGAIVMFTLILYTPFLRELFHFSLLSFNGFTIALSAGIFSVAWFEILRLKIKKEKKGRKKGRKKGC